MKSDILPMLKKELKILKDRKFIIGIMLPIIILYGIGQTISFGVESSVKEIKESGIKIVLLNADAAPPELSVVPIIVSASNESGFRIDVINVSSGNNIVKSKWDEIISDSSDINDIVTKIKSIGELYGDLPNDDLILEYITNADFVMYIPCNFTWNVLLGISPYIFTYYKGPEDPFSVFGSVKTDIASNFIKILGKLLNYYVITRYYPDFPPQTIFYPLRTSAYTFYRGEIVNGTPDEVFGTMFGSTFMIPLIGFMLVIYASSTAANSMSEERQNKTLETLLTLPIRRRSIVLGKVFGMIIVSGIMAAFYFVGLVLYMYSLMSAGMTSEGITKMSFISGFSSVFSPAGLILFALSIILTAGIGALIGLIVGSFSEDVRTASTFVSMVTMPLVLPTFIFMYIPIKLESLVTYLVMLDPFVDFMIVLKAVTSENLLIAGVAVVYLIIIFSVLVYFTVRLFESERIIIGGFKKKLGKSTGLKLVKIGKIGFWP